MNKHYFKRIFESIITRRKDALLIFFIVLILSVFIIISICISNLGIKISDSIKKDFEVEMYINNLLISNDAKTNIKNNAVKEIYDNKDELLNKENDQVKMSMSFKSKSNLSDVEYTEIVDEYGNITRATSFIEATIYSLLDEETLVNEGFTLKKGSFLNDDDKDYVLANENLYIDGKSVEVGDILILTVNNIDYEYTVIGTFNYYNDKSILNDNFFYDNAVNIIMTSDDLFEICLDNNVRIDITNFSLCFINGNRYDKMYKKFDSYINSILNKYNLVSSTSIETNIEEYDNMVEPTNNMSTLYSIISIVMIIISCLLLSNVVRYINENRIKEYAILLSLGQNKILSIISFGIEILIITNIAISLALPIGISIAKVTSQSLLDSNLKRQERLAYITGDDRQIDIFEIQSVLYDDYKVDINGTEILEIYLLNNGLVIISCLFVFITIYKSKPRELLLNT